MGLTVALPGLIAIVLADPEDALGIYEAYLAAVLAFVLAFSGVMAGREAVRVEVHDANARAHLASKEKTELEEKLSVAQTFLQFEQSKNSNLKAQLEQANAAASQATSAPSTPIRGPDGKFLPKNSTA